MRMKNVFNREVNVKVTIEAYPLVGELAVYRQTIKDGVSKDKVYEGVAIEQDIYGAVGLDRIKIGKWHLFSKDAREEYRTGYVSDKFYDSMIKNPFSYIEEHGGNDYEPLHFDFNNFKLSDVSGSVLPRSFYFDYVQARLDNSNHNLLEILEKFSKLDTEILAKDRHEYRGAFKPIEGDLKRFIMDIEYYNSEEGRDKYIQARWNPSVKEWKEFIEMESTKYGEEAKAITYLLSK